MKQQMRFGWAVLVAACCVGAACVQSDEAREEFCQNADPERQQDICGTDPGDGGTKPDGGVTQPSCTLASDCALPPNPCSNPGTCIKGQCAYPPKEDGTSCSDSTQGQCNESQGMCRSGVCRYSPKTVGTPCADTNSCTLDDKCDGAGACTGNLLACNPPPSQCQEWVGSCSNGKCDYRLKTSGSTCDDGDACTINDSCDSTGKCAGTRLNCTPPTQCQEWAQTCSNNACNWRFKQAGSACDDGNLCTVGDTCDASGQCVAGGPETCTPPAFCFESQGCDPNLGCRYRDTCSAPCMCVAGGGCVAAPQMTAGQNGGGGNRSLAAAPECAIQIKEHRFEERKPGIDNQSTLPR
jgi:hypothetical protein